MCWCLEEEDEEELGSWRLGKVSFGYLGGLFERKQTY